MRFAPKRLLAAAVVVGTVVTLLVGVGGTASADPGTSTWVEVDTYVYGPCTNPIHITGFAHYVATDRGRADVERGQTILWGVEDGTGNIYRVIDVTVDVDHGFPPNRTETFVNQYKFIGPGHTPDFWAQMVIHLTFPHGEPTADVLVDRVVCSEE